jgi:hypothetical protein
MTYGHDRKAKTEERREAVLLMDHRGWAALSRKSEDAIALLKKCVELGLDSMGAGTHLGEDRPLQESLRTLEALASGNASFDAEDYPSAPGVDTKTYQIFGGGIPSLLPETAWTERVAAAMILGICPVFMQLAGRPDRSDLLRFLSSDAEEIQACSARIDEEARTLLEGNIPEQTLPD